MFSIKIENVTQLDFCWIGEDGELVGSSMNLDIIIRGDHNNEESVILDFSTAKKEVKEILDNSFDHKILFYENISKGTYSYSYQNDTFKIETPLIELECPGISFGVVPDEKKFFSKYVTEKLNERFNGNFKCDLMIQEKDSLKNYFSYVHFLKNSSSLGCRRIHGHLSYVKSKNRELDQKIAGYLNDKIIVSQENIKNLSEKEIEIEYQAHCGNFYLKAKSPLKWIILPKAPTIENIMEHIVEKFKEDITPDCELYISEGLTKGCLL